MDPRTRGPLDPEAPSFAKEMLTGWIRLVKITKALPASGLRVFKLMARDIHVGHRIALLEPQGARHHTPLREVVSVRLPLPAN